MACASYPTVAPAGDLAESGAAVPCRHNDSGGGATRDRDDYLIANIDARAERRFDAPERLFDARPGAKRLA